MIAKTHNLKGYRNRFVRFLFVIIMLALSTGPILAEEVESAKTDSIFERTNPKDIGRLYQMLKIFDQVAKDNGIVYWMDSGTLLGAVRHEGIIPWDDDADLMIFEVDRRKLMALEPEFSKYGFYLKDCDTVIRVFPTFTQHYPFIDILTARFDPETQRIDINHPDVRKDNPNEYFFLKEICQLVPMKLGPLVMMAPSNSCRYLKCNYGEDYMTKATWWNQVHWRKSEEVTLVDFSPAAYELEDPEPSLEENQ